MFLEDFCGDLIVFPKTNLSERLVLHKCVFSQAAKCVPRMKECDASIRTVVALTWLELLVA